MKTIKKIFAKKENEQEITLSSTGVQEEQQSRQVPPPLPPTPPELPKQLSPIDNVINYFDEGDIIKAYFNQRALDFCLFQRAKQNSNNFTTKFRWDGNEARKRNVTMTDIAINRHSITNRPFNDGEFLSQGDVIIELGLDPTSFSSYCINNNVSKVDTLLYVGIRLYSNYSGYLTYCVKDDFIGSCNLGNTIKDGDLLFTIRLAGNPQQEQKPINNVIFNFGMLDSAFIDKMDYLKWVIIKQWLVDDYSMVNKGDDILIVKDDTSYEKNITAKIKAPFSGLLVKKSSGALQKGSLICTIYSDYQYWVSSYPNEIEITTDNFTKDIVIFGKKCAGNTLGFKIGDDVKINFENIGSKNYLKLRYERKKINLNKKCSLHLLFDNDSVVTLNAISNPVKVESWASDSIIKYSLSLDDLKTLEQHRLVQWQIINGDGIKVASGANICCCEYNEYNPTKMTLSADVLKDFIMKYNKAVEDNITTQLVQDNDESNHPIKEKTCFVYLMIDTTNNFYKIGISNNPRYREHTLQSDKPTIELISAKEYPTRTIAEAIEAALHKAYGEKRIRGEWFNLNEEDVENIKETLK